MADYLALHGFTQRGSMWEEVAAEVGGDWAMPDLPGHGGTAVPDWEGAVGLVASWIGAAGPDVAVVGYSMGGRLALAAALQGGVALRSLVLISASPGIADDRLRESRRAADTATADRIERLGLDLFLIEWLASPMFSGLGRRPAAWGARDQRMRQTNDPTGLADAVRLLGQGSQPYFGDRIGTLTVPLTTVAGSEDPTYVGHARRMAEAASVGHFVEVRGAGHAVVGEDPRAICRVLSA